MPRQSITSEVVATEAALESRIAVWRWRMMVVGELLDKAIAVLNCARRFELLLRNEIVRGEKRAIDHSGRETSYAYLLVSALDSFDPHSALLILEAQFRGSLGTGSTMIVSWSMLVA